VGFGRDGRRDAGRQLARAGDHTGKDPANHCYRSGGPATGSDFVGARKNLKDQAAKTPMRSFLGSVFLEQGRHQEARAAFRGSTTERGGLQSGSPKEGRTLSAGLGLAELEIRSGGNLDAALDYATESIRTGGQLYRKFEPDGYARALAIRAWAVGRLNRWGMRCSAALQGNLPGWAANER